MDLYFLMCVALDSFFKKWDINVLDIEIYFENANEPQMLCSKMPGKYHFGSLSHQTALGIDHTVRSPISNTTLCLVVMV